MDDTGKILELLKREAAEHRARRQEAGLPLMKWPLGFRDRVLTLVEQGAKASALSRELGISNGLINKWNRGRGNKADAGSSCFKELGIVPAASRPKSIPSKSTFRKDVVIAGARGATVTGLGFEHIVALLKAGLL